MTRTRTITLTLGSLAVGAVLATGVSGLAMADDQLPSNTGATVATAPGPQSGPQEGHRGHGPGERGMRGGPHGMPLHGEMVVKAEDGTITTVRQVRGTVTAVSPTSITITAEDGYAGTFTVTSDTEVHVGLPARGTAPTSGTITDVKVGDVADVHGTVTGSTATADEVRAMTAAEAAQLEQMRRDHLAARGDTAGATGSDD